jgi:hypothetical protein
MAQHPRDTLCPKHSLPLERGVAEARDSGDLLSTKPPPMHTTCAVVPWRCPKCDYTIDEVV